MTGHCFCRARSAMARPHSSSTRLACAEPWALTLGTLLPAVHAVALLGLVIGAFGIKAMQPKLGTLAPLKSASPVYQRLGRWKGAGFDRSSLR